MRHKKPSGRDGSRTEYFMDQTTMRKTRYDADVMISSVKRRKNSEGAYATFPFKCGCGCGPVGTVKFEK